MSNGPEIGQLVNVRGKVGRVSTKRPGDRFDITCKDGEDLSEVPLAEMSPEPEAEQTQEPVSHARQQPAAAPELPPAASTVPTGEPGTEPIQPTPAEVEADASAPPPPENPES